MLRNRLILLLLLNILSIALLKAQTAARDSFFQIWNTKSLHDTVRMRALTKFIDTYSITKEPDSNRYYSFILLKVAKEKNNPYFQGLALYSLGNSAIHLGLNQEARDYHTQAFELLQKEGNQREIARSYNSLGLINQDLGEYDLAIQQFEKSIEIKTQLGDTLTIAPNLLNIAGIYEIKGDILKSLTYNQRGLNISKLAKIEDYEAIANNNIANNYKYLGDFSKAVNHYLQAVAIYERTENLEGVVSTLNNLALLLIANKDYSKAKEYLDKALKISVDSEFFINQAMTLANKGYLYQEQKHFPEALSAFQECFKLIEKREILMMKPFIQLEIGIIYLNQNRLTEAENYPNSRPGQ